MKRVLAYWWFILLGALLANIIAINAGPITGDLKINVTLRQLHAIESALDETRSVGGALPEDVSEFESFLTAGRIRGGRLDPWGRSIIYLLDTEPKGYRLYSVGVDDRDDGGAGDDVITGPKKYRCQDYKINCLAVDVPIKASLAVAVLALLAGVGRGVNALWQRLRPGDAGISP